jgi:hypothetical protein
VSDDAVLTIRRDRIIMAKLSTVGYIHNEGLDWTSECGAAGQTARLFQRSKSPAEKEKSVIATV